MTFTPAETSACRRLIEWALEEDLGSQGDVTSKAVIPADLRGRALFVARAAGILAGLPAVKLVWEALDRSLSFQPLAAEGDRVQAGQTLAEIRGLMRSILAGERVALNFLQRLSGIATLTRRYVDAVAGLPCQILDTRKTTPGWRLPEKYAVRCGGGSNHRLGLYDGVLIKDNHLAALRVSDSRSLAIEIERALQTARAKVGGAIPLEIEVDSLEQFDIALDGRPESILLDNMPLDEMREAVRRRDDETTDERSPGAPPVVLLEASGGVTLDNVRAIAETGVDRISVGALTHSAPALDIGLDYVNS